MPSRAAKLCKLHLNKESSLRTQLLLSFLQLAAVSLLLALGVVVGAKAFIGSKAEYEAHASLEEEIRRHILAASVEAAATIGVLDAKAFALRDGLQEEESAVRAQNAERGASETSHTVRSWGSSTSTGTSPGKPAA